MNITSDNNINGDIYITDLRLFTVKETIMYKLTK